MGDWARLTQEYLEALVTSRERNARITQLFMDVLISNRERSARITQTYLEVLVLDYMAPAPAGGRKYGPPAQM